MRLSNFILENMELILSRWEAFAATLLPGAQGMTPLALRNHAQQILEAVAKDLETPQTRLQQAEKSRGRQSRDLASPETAAQTHAVLRAQNAFDINQLVAEYRALRASVLQLWLDAHSTSDADLEQMIRFNEAIDQAVAESVGHFHRQVERSRNLFLGMLGHDMRTPLSSIVSTASYLAALNAGDQVSSSAQRLMRSGASMQSLLDDLVDFNRAQFGLGIKAIRTDVDLAALLEIELEQLRDVYTRNQLELIVQGDTHGHWDGARLQQVLRNLVGNAVKHGAIDTAVRVLLVSEEDVVRLEVANRGPAIDPTLVREIFNPLHRGGVDEHPLHGTSGHNLGLGLFIVREIAAAHGGSVNVRSSDDETVFVVLLPRQKSNVNL